MPTRKPDLVPVHEAAKSLGVSPDTIRRYAKKGLIKSTRSSENHRLFSLKELARLNSKRGQKSRYRVLPKKKRSGVSAIELFTGCGGMALGFERAGITSKLLVEFDKNACATLRKNWPKKQVYEGDVSAVDFTDYAGKIDIVAGGFPCQAFSYAGFSRGFADTRGTLFFEFARCVQEVRPKIAVGENVRGLLKHDDGRTLETMLTALREIGYRPSFHLLRAQFLDVPQKRERLIILAVREDLATDTPYLFPKERDYTVPLGEALKDVPGSPGQTYSKARHKIMEQVPEGGYWRDLPDSDQRSHMGASYFLTGGRTGMARRLHRDEPSLTLTCSPSQKQTERCHPTETRPLSTREYARIQTFPDDWEFTGSMSSVYKQIGNAVPVNLAHHLGRCLIAMLDPSSVTPEMEEGSEWEPEKNQMYLPLVAVAS